MTSIRTIGPLLSGFVVGAAVPLVYAVPLAGVSAALLIIYGLALSFLSGAITLERGWFPAFRQLDRLMSVGRTIRIKSWPVLALVGIVAGAVTQLIFHAIAQA